METLRRWWRKMGRSAYPEAQRLLITSDGVGSNSSRSRQWKLELQGLADEIGLRLSVFHFARGEEMEQDRPPDVSLRPPDCPACIPEP